MIDFIGFIDYVRTFYGPGGIYDFGAKNAVSDCMYAMQQGLHSSMAI
jgi:hypothetical protein